MAKTFYKSHTWLWKRWVIDKKTIKEIAQECECSEETINAWLNQHKLRETRKK